MSAHWSAAGASPVTLRGKSGVLSACSIAVLWDGDIFAALHGLHDKPAVDELVRCVSDRLLITNIWIGEGELSFPEAYGEELKCGAAEGGARISIFVFPFRHRYRDLARPDACIAADATSACGSRQE